MTRFNAPKMLVWIPRNVLPVKQLEPVVSLHLPHGRKLRLRNGPLHRRWAGRQPRPPREFGHSGHRVVNEIFVPHEMYVVRLVFLKLEIRHDVRRPVVPVPYVTKTSDL